VRVDWKEKDMNGRTSRGKEEIGDRKERRGMEGRRGEGGRRKNEVELEKGGTHEDSQKNLS